LLCFNLSGVTSKLQHFVDSGIGGIWLSPIYASPMIDFGYDISDFKDVDRMFGTMQDLEELTAQAKKLGIKVKFEDYFLFSFFSKNLLKIFRIILIGTSRLSSKSHF